MASTIQLTLLNVEVDAVLWEDLVRRFAVEEHHKDNFVAQDFMAIPGADSTGVEDHALADALDLIKFRLRHRFQIALIEKYRTGSEFQADGDAEAIFELAFRAAEGISMRTMDSADYSVTLMVRIEIFFWVILQVMRRERGEYMDVRHRGADVRLGVNSDLLEIDFSSIAG
jgi:hypothetical protein